MKSLITLSHEVAMSFAGISQNSTQAKHRALVEELISRTATEQEFVQSVCQHNLGFANKNLELELILSITYATFQ